MFGFGKCKHPFSRLAVFKDQTVVPSPKYPKDYNLVNIHLFCQACGEELDIEYAQVLRSTDEVVKEMVEELKKGEVIH